MNIYEMILVAFSIIALVVCLMPSKKLKLISFSISSLILIFLFAMQDISVGADTTAYYNAFYYISSLSFKDIFWTGWEPGYLILNWFLGYFFDDGRILIVVLAFFILLPIFTHIYKESLWPELSLVIFVGTGMWMASMGIFRQWCAMAVLVFSYKYIKEKSFWKFILVILIAMSFHRTAIIFLLAYFISKVTLNYKNMIFSFAISIVLGFSGRYILQVLNQFARITESENFNGGLTMLIVLWASVFSVWILYKNKIPKDLELYYRLLYLAAVLQPIAFTFSNWSRVVIYFSISLIILFPNFIVTLCKTKKMYIYRIPLGFILCTLMYIWLTLLPMREYQFMR